MGCPHTCSFFWITFLAPPKFPKCTEYIFFSSPRTVFTFLQIQQAASGHMSPPEGSCSSMFISHIPHTGPRSDPTQFKQAVCTTDMLILHPICIRDGWVALAKGVCFPRVKFLDHLQPLEGIRPPGLVSLKS